MSRNRRRFKGKKDTTRIMLGISFALLTVAGCRISEEQAVDMSRPPKAAAKEDSGSNEEEFSLKKRISVCILRISPEAPRMEVLLFYEMECLFFSRKDPSGAVVASGGVGGLWGTGAPYTGSYGFSLTGKGDSRRMLGVCEVRDGRRKEGEEQPQIKELKAECLASGKSSASVVQKMDGGDLIVFVFAVND